MDRLRDCPMKLEEYEEYLKSLDWSDHLSSLEDVRHTNALKIAVSCGQDFLHLYGFYLENYGGTDDTRGEGNSVH